MTFKKLKDLAPIVKDINKDPYGRPDPRFQGRKTFVGDNIKRVANTKNDMALQEMFVHGELKSVGWDRVCGQCLTPDSQIMTDSGLKPIKEVIMGDSVLTHLGRFRKVIKTFVREHHGKVRRIRVAGNPDWIELTDDHPILARRLGFSHRHLKLLQIGWVKAKELEARTPELIQWTPMYPRLKETIPYDGNAFTETIRGDFSFPLNQDSMKVVGYWLAEGSILKRKRYGVCGISYSFGKSLREYAYAKDAADALSHLGYRPFLWLGQDGLWHLKVNNAKLGRFMDEEFGHNASSKKTPNWMKLLPTNLLDVLLTSYLVGDGIEYRPACYSAASVSKRLIYDLRDVGLKIGYTIQIFKGMKGGPMKIQGRVVNTKPSWQIRFNDRKAQGRNTMRADPDYLYPRIKEIQDIEYDGPVYNLEVEEDNSYCSALFAVHNCINFYKDPNLKNKKHGRCRAYGFKEVHEELTAEVKHNYKEPDGQFTFSEWPGCPTWTSRDRMSRK